MPKIAEMLKIHKKGLKINFNLDLLNSTSAQSLIW